MAMTVVHVYHNNRQAAVDAIRVILDADYLDDIIRDRKAREAESDPLFAEEATSPAIKPAVSRRNKRKSPAVTAETQEIGVLTRA